MSIKQGAKQTLSILAGSFVLAGIMVIVFAVLGYFALSVVWGALLGVFCATLNFFLLALTLEYALGKGARKAQGIMGLSYTVRIVIIAVIVVFAIKSPHINYVATAIPLLFPRIVIYVINFLNKGKKEDDGIERTEDTV